MLFATLQFPACAYLIACQAKTTAAESQVLTRKHLVTGLCFYLLVQIAKAVQTMGLATEQVF